VITAGGVASAAGEGRPPVVYPNSAVNSIADQRAHGIPFTIQTRLNFDVILPLWGHRGPR